MNIEEQIGYWVGGAQEDWEAAGDLVEKGRIRHGLFFAHLSIEKLLKANVCRKTRALAPRIHNFVRLAEMAGIPLSPERLDRLADISRFGLEGRYPAPVVSLPAGEEAKSIMAKMKETREWLTAML